MKTELPVAARIPQLDRRTLFRNGLLGAGLTAMPGVTGAKTLSGFGYGVASGEPSADTVLLWTRFQAAQDSVLEWEASLNANFANVVAGGTITARAENDWCVKPVARGLQPDSWYYFRFVAPDGQTSQIGRTRTLPQGPTSRFRLAVVGCSNIGFGWFNAYAHIAEADDTDLVLHTGDYIYEYGRGVYPTKEQKLPGRMRGIDSEIIALADYRARYAQYRSDPDLQRLHQLFPMLHVPDDHESANDSYRDGAQNHQPDTEGPWDARKRASVRANREWMPVSDEPWAAYEIGDLATLFRLETRLEGRTKPFDLREIIGRGGKDPGKILAALQAFENDEWREASRTLMGDVQESWLADGLKASREDGKVWQILLQQTVMTSLKSSPDIANGMTDALPEFIRNRILGGVLTSMAGLPFNMDAWDGYPAARERLLKSAQEADANLIVLAGDSHNGWASELANMGAPAAIEFAGHSVSSPGMEAFLTWIKPEDMAAQSVQTNEQLKWANTKHRGYMSVELTPTKATSEYRFLETVRAKSTGLAGTQRISSDAGSHALDIG
ncbi:alkaline phosphatase D family protein [Pontixanthobacter aestiaquae]|uniref:Alkaline phosphatase n=2 Tax=Pontixanthobacter aestiaquae TaxID=1509367 RepID=A0A844Z0J5_9SPHN|nr:alkaline phosphatase D family protein [Pontixanthobacter aestiaquae]MDN3646767.1 alkaline phosphatase D family protein [Pontixanthobacter aestiaquae]MXO82251.1 alkaline phosphatase [Pontixanthobacter aestiaquae]